MASYLAYHLGLASPWQWLAYLGVALLQCGILMALVLTAAAMFTWMERKVVGRIQDRLGPTRVGGRFGWLQTLADGLKLITKEDLMPGEADAMLFRLAPYISFCASFAVYLALPFADGWVAPAAERGRLLHPCGGRAGSLRRNPRRLRLGLEVVAVRRHAGGGPGGQLRSAPWASVPWCRC